MTTEPMDPSPAAVDEARARAVMDRYIEFHAKTHNAAQAYETVVIVAGYGAFFALLTSAGQAITDHARLLSVALMTISIMLYMAWHIWQMLTRQKYEAMRGSAFALAEGDADALIQIWNEIDQKSDVASLRLMRWWKWIFWPTLATGFSGAGVLAWNAAAAALNLPLQLA